MVKYGRVILGVNSPFYQLKVHSRKAGLAVECPEDGHRSDQNTQVLSIKDIRNNFISVNLLVYA